MLLEDLKTIDAIAERAAKLYAKHGMNDHTVRFARIAIADELLTVHREIVPLRLDELLATDDGNFAHDIAGIHHHLAHTVPPGFSDGFMPRFAGQFEREGT